MAKAKKTAIADAKFEKGVEAILAQMIRPAMVPVVLRGANWSRSEIDEHQALAIRAAAKRFAANS